MRKVSMQSKLSLVRWLGIVTVGFLLVISSKVNALSVEYFVGVDGLTTIGSGVYAGLSNPNAGRLTFLFAHPNEANPSATHYHGIGAYSYSGPVDNPIINSTNTNNRLPEISSGEPPLPLLPGTGMHAGRLVSQTIPGIEYSNLQIQSTQSLDGFAAGTIENFLFHSSNDRWFGPLDNVLVGLQLVSITDGLQIANELGDVILSSLDDIYTLGAGNSLIFTPTFFTSHDALAGVYSAAFRLVDLNGGLLESGLFNFDFQVAQVSEPFTIPLLLIGLIGLAVTRVVKFITLFGKNVHS